MAAFLIESIGFSATHSISEMLKFEVEIKFHTVPAIL